MDFEYEALFATFLAEAQDNLAAAETGLLALEGRPDEKSHIDQVFRAVHTLKGNSSSLGFRNFAEFAHALEDLLEGVRRGRTRATAGLVTLLLSAVDVMKGWLPTLQIGTEDVPGAEAAALLERVQRFRTEGEMALAAGGDVPKGDRPAAEARSVMRVEAARMDALLDLAGEMTIAAERLRRSLDSLPLSVRSTIGDSVEQSERLLHSLKLGLEPTPLMARTCLVITDVAVADGPSSVMAVLTEDVRQVVDFTEDNIEPPPAFGTKIDLSFLQGMGDLGDHFALILDTDKVLTTMELIAAQAAVREATESSEAVPVTEKAPKPAKRRRGKR